MRCSCVLVYLIVKIDFLIVTCVLSNDHKAFPIKLVPAQMHCLKKMRRHVLILLVYCFLISSSFKSLFSLPRFFFSLNYLFWYFTHLSLCEAHNSKLIINLSVIYNVMSSETSQERDVPTAHSQICPGKVSWITSVKCWTSKPLYHTWCTVFEFWTGV